MSRVQSSSSFIRWHITSGRLDRLARLAVRNLCEHAGKGATRRINKLMNTYRMLVTSERWLLTYTTYVHNAHCDHVKSVM